MNPCPECGRPLESGAAACASCSPQDSKPSSDALTGGQIFFGLLVGFAVIGWMVNAKLNPPVPRKATASASSAVDQGPETRTGVHGRYQFVSMRMGDDVTATFTPFLPPDDVIVTNALRKVVQTAYGVNIDTASPRLVQREIVFQSGPSAFWITLVKQDTREVHSIAIRRRPA